MNTIRFFLFTLLIPINVYANTYDLNFANSDTAFNDGIGTHHINSKFIDTFNFNGDSLSSITSAEVKVIFTIKNSLNPGDNGWQLDSGNLDAFTITQDIDVSSDSTIFTFLGVVNEVSYIQFSGTGTGSPNNKGQYLTEFNVISTVPLPAAAWFMGTALVGLVSFGRRKQAA